MPPVGTGSYTEVSVLVYVANGVLVCAAIEVMHRYHRVYKRATADLVTAKTMEEAARHATEAVNRELQDSNRDLEQFAYVASHDLQEPLRMIVSYAQLLKRRYHGRIDGDANAFLDFMVEGATRMQTMVIDLLEYSRLDRAGETATRFDSGEAIAAVVASLSLAVAEAGAVVELGAMPPIHYHRSQFLRLLRNLIDNAVKYRDPARPLTVRIDARRDGDRWVFSVADNGIGIDPAYFSRIFLIFQRLHTRDKYDGTGIGLAMCKRIVERHGGKIWIESQPDGGTTVLFDLRVHGDESHADGTPPSSQ
ncbi:MAG: PAS domain-containing sensor histidine kinase [Magnetospirillum sp.]|nr:PAS domain-containing sensor histidine kinase [Magnetospirillum sp.]